MLLISKIMHCGKGKGANVAMFFPKYIKYALSFPSHNTSFWDKRNGLYTFDLIPYTIQMVTITIWSISNIDY